MVSVHQPGEEAPEKNGCGLLNVGSLLSGLQSWRTHPYLAQGYDNILESGLVLSIAQNGRAEQINITTFLARIPSSHVQVSLDSALKSPRSTSLF